MSIRGKIARIIAPGVRTEAEISELVATEVKKLRSEQAAWHDYDPNNEGYRRLTSSKDRMRDLSPVAQDRMFQLAYWFYDTYGMIKRLVQFKSNFIFGDDLTWEVVNDTPDGAALEVIEEFWTDDRNKLNKNMNKRIEWLFVLGEQCWPVQVDERTGFCRCGYIDPANIDGRGSTDSFSGNIYGRQITWKRRAAGASIASDPAADGSFGTGFRDVVRGLFFSFPSTTLRIHREAGPICCRRWIWSA